MLRRLKERLKGQQKFLEDSSGLRQCEELLSKNRVTEGLFCLLDAFFVGEDSAGIERMTSYLQGLGYTNKDIAGLYLLFSDALRKKAQREIALGILQKARELDPSNSEVFKKARILHLFSRVISKYEGPISQGLMDESQLEEAVVISYKIEKSVEYVLINEFKIPKEIIGEALSKYYGCPFKAYDPNLKLPAEILSNLKKSFLVHEHWVPLGWDREGVEILIDDPSDLRKTGSIKGLVKSPKVRFLVGVREDIEAFIEEFFSAQQSLAPKPIEEMIKGLEVFPDLRLEEEREEQLTQIDESSSQIVKFVDQILYLAYKERASDIHIEPSAITKKVHIRFRMDGVLKEVVQVPINMANSIMSRLKILANLDIAEKRLPQDGKILFKRKAIPTFELRLATFPTVGGLEDAVLRILAKAGAMKLEEMGLTDENLKNIRKIISQPYGLILVVGPTGSGKTTTLHSILGELNQPGVKVLTAEDPVEITQQGLRQVEVKPKIGLDFSRVMRAFLRADPDIIMIGEMRDHETAATAIEASLTGHLVLSTLHTNSAPETVTRILDMGLNPLNFSDSFLGVLAQRLLRRLCPKCKEEYEPSPEEIEEIENELKGVIPPESLEGIRLFRPPNRDGVIGCENCSHTGYRGRAAIHELLQGTKEIKRLIRKQATTDQLFAQAKADGMLTLKQDGLLKVLRGVTDLTELRRVVIT